MSRLSYKLIPIIILLSGPPAFRKMADTNNILTATVDIWIIYQIIGYMLALFLMFKYRNKYINFDKNIYDYLIFLNFFSLLVSCLISDDIVTSAAYTFLYSIGVYFYYYSKKFYFDVNEDSIIQVYILIRNVFLSLLLIVLMFYFLTDGYVVAGYRISGGRIANVLIIAPIIFLISCFISTTSYNNLTNKIAIVLSLFFLFEAFSRSTWWSTILTTFLLYIKIFFYSANKSDTIKNQINFFLVVIFIILIFSLYFSEIKIYLTRGQDDVFSVSGRDVIAEWVFGYMKDNFFGLGLGTGFKRIFPFLTHFNPYEFENASIGTAHNAYLEILMAGGWMSLISFSFISILPLIYFIKNFKKIINSNFYPLFILFIFTTLNNMVNAQSTLPSYLIFSFSWLVLALINLYIYRKK
jgi:O-antigen ligase